jgi:hypothetical protein
LPLDVLVELPKLTEKKQKSTNESRKEGKNPLFFAFLKIFSKKFQKKLDVLRGFVYNVPVTARQRDKQA